MESMEPNPAFDPESYPGVIEAFDALGPETKILVWGADWCTDTRQELPDFAATLEASSVPESQIEVYEVDREKAGPKVEEYDVELIPTVVVEADGEVVARFEESESVPAPVFLAEQLSDSGLAHY